MVQKKLNINFQKIADVGHRGVRRAAAFVAMGQKAWSDESISSAVVEAPFSFQLLPDPLPKDLAEEVRTAFRLWVIGNAITEIVQGLGLFADECFQLAVLVPFNNKPVSQEALDKARRCRNDTNLHSKLLMISEEAGLKSPLLDHTDGWVRARNALAHNHGVVRVRDYSPDTEVLTISWRQFDFSIDGKKIDNIVGHTVEKGGKLGFSLGHGSKDFNLGEQVVFSEQEILNICLTAYFHVASTVTELEKYVGKFVEVPSKQEAASAS
ncbi:MAG TPA: hypothetical protein VJL90_05735 [Pseudorhodoplanes sp.]|nr:hypothetical protein [Pseudorhodoplanes sp.]